MATYLQSLLAILILLLLVLILIILVVLLILILIVLSALILVLILVVLHFILRSPPNEILQPQSAEHRLLVQKTDFSFAFTVLYQARYYYAQKSLRYSQRL